MAHRRFNSGATFEDLVWSGKPQEEHMEVDWMVSRTRDKRRGWRGISKDADSLESEAESWILKGCVRSKKWAGKLKQQMRKKCSYNRTPSLEVIWWSREDPKILPG
jgi:hypothetical protein